MIHYQVLAFVAETGHDALNIDLVAGVHYLLIFNALLCIPQESNQSKEAVTIKMTYVPKLTIGSSKYIIDFKQNVCKHHLLVTHSLNY